MVELPKDIKGWQKARERDREEKEHDRLDLREDGQSADMDVNGDGVVDANDIHYSPDKKGSEAKEEKEPEKEVRRGFRR